MTERKIDKEKELKKALEEIEFIKEQERAEGRTFSVPSEEELKNKIKRTNTPYISGQSWNHGAPGTTVTYRVYIRNPDPTSARLNAYVFFGPANPVSDVGEALALADTRFPRLGARSIFISSGSSSNVSFSIKTPEVDSSVYFGNCFVFRGSYHDIGSYIDRGFFPVNLS